MIREGGSKGVAGMKIRSVITTVEGVIISHIIVRIKARPSLVSCR